MDSSQLPAKTSKDIDVFSDIDIDAATLWSFISNKFTDFDKLIIYQYSFAVRCRKFSILFVWTTDLL